MSKVLHIKDAYFKIPDKCKDDFGCAITLLGIYLQMNNLTMDDMKKAYEDLKTYLAIKMNERNSMLQYANIEGINERQMQILKLVNDSPSLVLTSQEVSVRFGVSDRTARTDLNDLSERGYLKRIPINKKQMGFIKV